MKNGEYIWVMCKVVSENLNGRMVVSNFGHEFLVDTKDCRPLKQQQTAANTPTVDSRLEPPVNPKPSFRSVFDDEIIQAGDWFFTSRDQKYHLANFTVGMTCKDAMDRGIAQGEKWNFYRPMVNAK